MDHASRLAEYACGVQLFLALLVRNRSRLLRLRLAVEPDPRADGVNEMPRRWATSATGLPFSVTCLSFWILNNSGNAGDSRHLLNGPHYEARRYLRNQGRFSRL